MSLDLGGGSVCRNAGACGKARKASEGWLKGGGDARPVHSTAQHPFQDIMAQRELCCQKGQRMPLLKLEWQRAAPQLHCTTRVLGGSMVRPRRCRRPVWTSPLSSSRTRERKRVTNQAEAGWQTQIKGMRKRFHTSELVS
jgi:hypothetical protein